MVEGKFGIKATVLAHSVSEAGIEMLTYEIEYPRIILSELNTHRMLSKNSASSRAIPFEKMKQQLNGRPVRFGQANKGMQDKGEDYNHKFVFSGGSGIGAWGYETDYEAVWEYAKQDAIKWSNTFYDAGYHKQVYNRLTEPFQMMKTVISGTEWANFFWLRDHEAADPTIAELARVMRIAKDQSKPVLLKAGEWHLPYVAAEFNFVGEDGFGNAKFEQMFFIDEEKTQPIALTDAIKVSAARSAAVSFRNIDYGLEKSLEVFERLVGDERKHSSAFEHAATPMNKPVEAIRGGNSCVLNLPKYPSTWEDGVSHMDRNGQLWSGNLCGWVQYRKLIPSENYI